MSTLPPEFLEGLDARAVFLYQSADETRQALKWLVQKRHETDVRLGDIQSDLTEVKTQTTRTNGRVTATETKVAALETDPGVHLARLGARAIRSKWFWVATVIAVLIGLPALVDNAPVIMGILKAALGA